MNEDIMKMKSEIRLIKLAKITKDIEEYITNASYFKRIKRENKIIINNQ
jgi:hypothetical protein